MKLSNIKAGQWLLLTKDACDYSQAQGRNVVVIPKGSNVEVLEVGSVTVKVRDPLGVSKWVPPESLAPVKQASFSMLGEEVFQR